MFINIRGIRDIKFNSREAHMMRKFLEEITAIVLKIRVRENSMACGRRVNI